MEQYGGRQIQRSGLTRYPSVFRSRKAEFTPRRRVIYEFQKKRDQLWPSGKPWGRHAVDYTVVTPNQQEVSETQ